MGWGGKDDNDSCYNRTYNNRFRYKQKIHDYIFVFVVIIRNTLVLLFLFLNIIAVFIKYFTYPINQPLPSWYFIILFAFEEFISVQHTSTPSPEAIDSSAPINSPICYNVLGSDFPHNWFSITSIIDCFIVTYYFEGLII